MRPAAALAARCLAACVARGRAQQVTIGDGASLSVSSGYVKVTSASVACTLSDGSASTCLQITSQALPDHPIGPWCDGAAARAVWRVAGGLVTCWFSWPRMLRTR
jgi:hypothetical protein